MERHGTLAIHEQFFRQYISECPRTSAPKVQFDTILWNSIQKIILSKAVITIHAEMERKPVLTTTEITTELELHVQEPIDGHPLWGSRFLVKDRAACLKAYQNLIRSGAGVLMTNTYQATPDAFVKHMGLSEREAAHIFEDSVKICQQAIELEKKKGEVSICGAIGSLNALRGDGSEYSGEFCNTYSDQEYLDMHRPRVKALVDSGVDFLCFETLPCSKEALFLIGLLEEFPNVKAWISFFGRNTKEISNGEIFADVAVKCWEKGEDRLLAVGVNCLDPAWVTPLFKSLKAANPNIPFIAYPNSGEKYDTESKRWTPCDSQKTVAEFLPEWLDMGIAYVGGCCRNYARDLKDMRRTYDQWTSRRVALE